MITRTRNLKMMALFENRKRVIYDRTNSVPYLIRYYLFLIDRVKFPFNLTLHKILVSDLDDLHDHPWDYFTIILKGGYYEHTPEGKFWRGPGHFRFCKAQSLHRLELKKDTDGNEICGFDELLEVHGPLDSSGTTLRGIVNVTSGGIVNVTSKVSFIYDGSTQPGTFVLCDQRGWGSDARAIEVLATGRTRNLIATESSQISSCNP